MSFEFKNCDALDYIQELKERNKKVDLILTDPPYNVSIKGCDNINGRTLDFGEWDHGFDLTGWITGIDQIVSKNGTVIIFTAWRNLGEIANALENNGFEVKDCLVWEKNNPWPRNRDRRYVQTNEYMIVAVKKGAKWTFNRPSEVSYLRQVFKHPVPNGEFRIHPTQKPLSLIQELVKTHSNKGDTILDLFAGSGVVLLAGKLLGRKVYGCEIDNEMWKKAIEVTFKMDHTVESAITWFKRT